MHRIRRNWRKRHRILRVRRRRQHDPPAQRGGDVMTYEYAGRLIVKETWRNGLAWYFEYDGTGVEFACVHVGRRRHARPQAQYVPGGRTEGARQPRGADGVPPPRRPCVEAGRCQRRGTHCGVMTTAANSSHRQTRSVTAPPQI